jgi:phospholipid/cholesterol/gamma-HCH transport system permease protein
MLGVDSLPIALFIAVPPASCRAARELLDPGAVLLYFVGTLVEKTVTMVRAVLTGLALAGRVGANIAAGWGHCGDRQIDALETLCDPHAYPSFLA